MIFTYYDGNLDDISEFLKDWGTNSLNPLVCNDDDVVPVLNDFNPEWANLYLKIRIAACKSDIARLALLIKFGGMYVDPHAASPQYNLLLHLFLSLSWAEVVVFKTPVQPNQDGDYYLLNGAFISRKNSETLYKYLSASFEKLINHFHAERTTSSYVEYNIADLTGSWNLRQLIYQNNSAFTILNPQYSQIINKVSLDKHEPFKFWGHYRYRKPGMHWSERMKSERLFTSD